VNYLENPHVMPIECAIGQALIIIVI